MSRKNIIWISAIVLIFGAVYIATLRDPDSSYLFIGWIAVVIVLLWIGNQLITKLFDKYFPWIRFGRKRFFIQLFLGMLFSLIIMNLAYFAFKILLTRDAPVPEQIIATNILGAFVVIPYYSIYFSLHFLKHWQQSELEVEKYQKESMRSQLSSLKNHLDPHFLFNNLNILSSLIDKDRDVSQEFLVRFAQVYRTLLMNKAEELITLEEEIEFIQSYIFLIETRFEHNIQFEMGLSEEANYCMLPPLTIQMLIENAIKHNIITESRPLKIRIENNDSRLVVKNSLYEKPEDIKSKSGTGLKNIKERFKYFTDEELKIEKTKDHFLVSIPLLEIETV